MTLRRAWVFPTFLRLASVIRCQKFSPPSRAASASALIRPW